MLWPPRARSRRAPASEVADPLHPPAYVPLASCTHAPTAWLDCNACITEWCDRHAEDVADFVEED